MRERMNSSKFCVVKRTYSWAMPSWSMCAWRLDASRLDHNMRLVISTPTREYPMIRDRVALVEQLVAGDHPREQPDPLGLGRVDIASCEHDVERARRADFPRQQI